MVNRLIFIYIAYLYTIVSLNAQKEFSTWYFGEGAGLRFTEGEAPQAISGSQINTNEGCATISDVNGDILFYTDGRSVWDKTHNKMPNAQGDIWEKAMSGDFSASQSAIVTPVIGLPDRYYLFTVDGVTSQIFGPKGEWDGLYYSVIDMNLNNGLGDVDTAFIHNLGYIHNKVPLQDTTAEKVIAVKHANNRDYWVVTRGNNNDSIYAFLVTCNGVNNIPVASKVDFTWQKTTMGFDLKGAGFLRATRDGKSIIEVDQAGAVLYDFDNNVGKILDHDTIIWGAHRDTIIGGGFMGDPKDTTVRVKDWHYGVEVSPNDSLIYTTTYFVGSGQGSVWVFKRFASNIQESGRKLHDHNSFAISTSALQIGLDDNIYMAHFKEKHLSYITDVNDYDNANFVYKGIDLNENSRIGLPNFFTTNDKWNVSIDYNDIIACSSDDSVKIDVQGSPLYEHAWTPNYNISDTSIADPVILLDSSLTYYVEVTTECTTLFDTVNVLISPLVEFSLEGDLEICEGEQTRIKSSIIDDSVLYNWNNGIQDTSIEVDEEGWYVLEVIWDECSSKDSLYVEVNPLPKFSLGNDTTLCADELELTLSPQWSELTDATGIRYAWSTGDTASHIIVVKEAEYWLEVEDTNGCDFENAMHLATINCDELVDVPTAFTPNGDNVNDFFEPILNNVTIKEFYVYNRWGELVFQGAGNSYVWDGKKEGVLQEVGAYNYRITTSSSKDIYSQLEGTILLVK